MTTHIGISCGFHDAAVSAINHRGDIVFAAHSERYSGIKHDKNLHPALIADAEQYYNPETVSYNYYEVPVKKYLRQVVSGEKTPAVTDFLNCFKPSAFAQLNVQRKQIKTHSHHLSHAAAAFQTSTFSEATVIVVDAIGEYDCVSIYHAEYNHAGVAKYRRLYEQSYPNSIGLFYAAATQAAGLKPLDEEYILMGMSAYGTDRLVSILESRYIHSYSDLEFTQNLHAGFVEKYEDAFDLAHGTQVITERLLNSVMQKARQLGSSKNLCYTGGVALNCLANRNLNKYFDKIWIMPNPGDAGSSLGAAALGFGRQINFTTAALGYNIEGEYPVEAVVKHLQEHKIAGIASGRAEFGPRALGHRSLLADPRDTDIRDRVNEIKQRQKFRPFAPMILAEFAEEYFDMPKNWTSTEYMQVVAQCRNPELFPAVVHYDGTSRIQTVKRGDSGPRRLLEAWYRATGCPLLLNTSLNVRGKPMVNTRADADEFEQLYQVRVFS